LNILVKLKRKKELNGLSLAGVGNKTTLENIQISFSNDDSLNVMVVNNFKQHYILQINR
jgi:hypothetical protein